MTPNVNPDYVSLLPESLRHPLNALVARHLSHSVCVILGSGSDAAAAYVASALFRAALAGISKLSRRELAYFSLDPFIMTTANEPRPASADRGAVTCRGENKYAA